jgi:acylphosphatase
MTKRVHLFISGRVQGVTFRASTKRKARDLGVRGWIKNLHDGRVEAVLEGSEGSVDQLVEWCHHGPGPARVEKVDVREEEVRNEFDGFQVRF